MATGNPIPVRQGFTTHNGKTMHWTQTPKGRLKLLAMSRARTGATSLYTAKRKGEILDYGERHGLSTKRLAERYKVTVSTIHYWRHQLGRAQARRGKHGTNAIVERQRDGNLAQHVEVEAHEQNKITYAVGECSAFCRLYAESIGVPAREFTRRVGELLLRKTHG
jgi:transposase-like protein